MRGHTLGSRKNGGGRGEGEETKHVTNSLKGGRGIERGIESSDKYTETVELSEEKLNPQRSET